jgi:hypothetical protein
MAHKAETAWPGAVQSDRVWPIQQPILKLVVANLDATHEDDLTARQARKWAGRSVSIGVLPSAETQLGLNAQPSMVLELRGAIFAVQAVLKAARFTIQTWLQRHVAC